MQSSENVADSRTELIHAERNRFGSAPPQPWYPSTAPGDDDDGQDHAHDDDPELKP